MKLTPSASQKKRYPEFPAPLPAGLTPSPALKQSIRTVSTLIGLGALIHPTARGGAAAMRAARDAERQPLGQITPLASADPAARGLMKQQDAASDFVKRKGYLTELRPGPSGILEAQIGDKACLVCGDLRGQYWMTVNQHRINLDLKFQSEDTRQGCVILDLDLTGETPQLNKRRVPTNRDAYLQNKNRKYGAAIRLDARSYNGKRYTVRLEPQPTETNAIKKIGRSMKKGGHKVVGSVSAGANFIGQTSGQIVSACTPVEDPGRHYFKNLDFQALQDGFEKAAQRDLEYLATLEEKEQHHPQRLSELEKTKLAWYRSLNNVPLRLTVDRSISYGIYERAGKRQYVAAPYLCNTYLDPDLRITLQGAYSRQPGPGWKEHSYFGPENKGEETSRDSEDIEVVAMPNLQDWYWNLEETVEKEKEYELYKREGEEAKRLPVHIFPAASRAPHTPILRLTRSARPQDPTSQPVAGQAQSTSGTLVLHQPPAEHHWIDFRNLPKGNLVPLPQNPRRPIVSWKKYSMPTAQHEDQQYQLKALLEAAASQQLPITFSLRYRLEGHRLVAHELVFGVSRDIAYAPDDHPELKAIKDFMLEWFQAYQQQDHALDFVMEAQIRREETPVPATQPTRSESAARTHAPPEAPGNSTPPESASAKETAGNAAPRNPAASRQAMLKTLNMAQLTRSQKLVILASVPITPEQQLAALDINLLTPEQIQVVQKTAPITQEQLMAALGSGMPVVLTREQKRTVLDAALLTPEQQLALLDAVQLTPEQQQAALSQCDSN